MQLGQAGVDPLDLGFVPEKLLSKGFQGLLIHRRTDGDQGDSLPLSPALLDKLGDLAQLLAAGDIADDQIRIVKIPGGIGAFGPDLLKIHIFYGDQVIGEAEIPAVVGGDRVPR